MKLGFEGQGQRLSVHLTESAGCPVEEGFDLNSPFFLGAKQGPPPSFPRDS